MTSFFGVDPGKAGAIAIITETASVIDLCDLPYIGNRLDPIALADILSQADGLRGALEEPFALATSGVPSVLTTGRNYGLLEGCVIHCAIPYQEVKPARWKKEMGVTADKETSVRLALQLFPDQRAAMQGPKGKWLDGRAEALLIAEWLRRKEMRA